MEVFNQSAEGVQKVILEAKELLVKQSPVPGGEGDIKITMDDLWNMAQVRFYGIYGKAYELDQYSKPIVELLLKYFMRDPEFETMGDGFSLDKGLGLVGGVGSGKTSLMKMFDINPVQSYVTHTCRQVMDMYSNEGSVAISYLWSQNYRPTILRNPFNHKKFGICLDDLCEEDIAKHYGNSRNVIAYVIKCWYDHINYFRGKTHFTTNSTADEIGEFYGAKVRSRMREMYNFIVLPNQPDRRK